MAQVIIAWFLAQSTMATVLGDWLYITEHLVVSDCHGYKGDAHNLFGNVCGTLLVDINSTVKTIQGLVLTNMALSVIYFFGVYMKPDNRWFKLILGLFIFTTGIISTVLWHTTDNESNVLNSVTNYYGIGWFFNIIVVVLAFIAIGLNIIDIP